MSTRQNFRAFIREILEEEISKEKNIGSGWMLGNDESLMLDKPGMLVPQDARKKISDYLKKMGLAK